MRRRFSRQRLSNKLLVVSAVNALLVVLLGTLLLSALSWMRLREDLVREGRTTARLVAVDVAPAMLFSDPTAGADAMEILSANPEVLGAEAVLADTRPFARYLRADQTEGIAHLTLADDELFRRDTVHLSVPIDVKGNRLGFVNVVMDMRPSYQRLRDFVLKIVAVEVFGLFTVIAVQFIMLRRLLQPVGQLLQVMRQVGSKADYGRRAPVVNGDEIGELSQGFNTMMGLIQEREASLETETRRREELQRDLHDGVGSRLVALAFHVRRSGSDPGLLAEVEGLIHEVHLIQGAVRAGPTTLDALLADVRHLYSRVGGGSLPLRWQVPDDMPRIALSAEQSLATVRILEEAIANALKHAQPSPVSISLISGHGAGATVLSVSDEGPGRFAPRAQGGLRNIQLRAQRAGLELRLLHETGRKSVQLVFQQLPGEPAPADAAA